MHKSDAGRIRQSLFADRKARLFENQLYKRRSEKSNGQVIRSGATLCWAADLPQAIYAGKRDAKPKFRSGYAGWKRGRRGIGE